jgi:hypothetical protein
MYYDSGTKFSATTSTKYTYQYYICSIGLQERGSSTAVDLARMAVLQLYSFTGMTYVSTLV